MVVLALGSTLATDWLTGSGLILANGEVCDAPCRAAPGIYAAGDVASWHNPRFGTRMRLEHRMNAIEQTVAAAGNLVGDAQPFAPVPYFWTDQCAAWSSNTRRGRLPQTVPLAGVKARSEPRTVGISGGGGFRELRAPLGRLVDCGAEQRRGPRSGRTAMRCRVQTRSAGSGVRRGPGGGAG
ncbi:hypothetical protein [Streptomyces noursei]|uniref:hypothetical protein n=1 Tax=Streptomyces noursei TaxID=1971 RepID=UPI003BF4BD1F